VAADNATKLAQLHKLESDFKQLPALKESLKQLAESVPSHPDLAAMISNLDALAAGTGTTIESIAVKDAQPYAPPAVTPAPASGTPGSTATPTSTPAPTSTAAPTAAPAKPQAPAPVTNSQVTAANFVAIPVTISVNGTYGQALNFVDGLQHGKRLFLVTTFASTKSAEAAAPAPAPTSGSTSGSSSAPTQAAAAPSWTVGGYVYVVLDSTKKAVPSQ
jgi:Tfp pilus assembly protein PilO